MTRLLPVCIAVLTAVGLAAQAPAPQRPDPRSLRLRGDRFKPLTYDAIAQGKQTTEMQKDEEAVYNFCSELLNTKQVSDATFAAAKNAVGERGVVDLIGVMGWYHTVSMLLNVDRYPLPDGARPELKPLK